MGLVSLRFRGAARTVFAKQLTESGLMHRSQYRINEKIGRIHEQCCSWI